MRLTDISIAGYKSYGVADTPISLGNLNIVIGANGAGKSNFISFLEMISYIATDAFGDFVAKNGYASSLMYSRKDKIDYIEGRMFFSSDRFRDEYTINIKQGVDGGLYIANEKIGYPSVDGAHTYETIQTASGMRSALIPASETDDASRAILNTLKGCRIYHFNDTSISSRMRMPGYVQDDRYLRSDGGNLAAYLYRMKNDKATEKYYQRIVDMIKEVFPRFDRFELHPRTDTGKDERISLNWREKGCEDIFGPHMLSDGTLRFIALCTLLLKPSSYRNDIVILDEPEIGLHPYAVRVLAEIMKMASKQSQIIVATQSRELLNSFDIENIIVAEFDHAKESSVLKRLDVDELSDWLDIKEDWHRQDERNVSPFFDVD